MKASLAKDKIALMQKTMQEPPAEAQDADMRLPCSTAISLAQMHIKVLLYNYICQVPRLRLL